MSKKKIDPSAIEAMKNELKGASHFFRRDQQNNVPEDPETALEAPKVTEVVSQVVKTENEQENVLRDMAESTTADVKTDVMKDVVTSLLQGVDKKSWQETIEDTETHNTSLRMSAKEKEQIEDVVRELKREYKIKTSINEIARLGLLLLAQDFKLKGKKSIIVDVKKS